MFCVFVGENLQSQLDFLNVNAITISILTISGINKTCYKNIEGSRPAEFTLTRLISISELLAYTYMQTLLKRPILSSRSRTHSNFHA